MRILVSSDGPVCFLHQIEETEVNVRSRYRREIERKVNAQGGTGKIAGGVAALHRGRDSRIPTASIGFAANRNR